MFDGPGFVFDPFDFAVHADPYPYYAVLRREHPVYYCEGAKCFVLSRYADIVEALQQPHIFSSSAGNVLNDSPEKIGRTVGSVDPPKHTAMRAPLNEAFSRKQVAHAASRMREDLVQLLAAAEAMGTFDLVRDVTAPLAGSVMAAFLGMDGADHGQFKRLLDISLYRDPVTRERTTEGVRAQADLVALVAEAVDHKRSNPGPDLISSLLQTGPDGRPPEPEDVIWTVRAVLGAGFESTSSLLANGALALLRHLDQRDRLAREPALIEAAIEEMLRYESPAQRFARVLIKDHALHGVEMAAGAKVMILYGSANRDETVFAEPDRFDIDRKPGRHLGFGNGLHFCAGAALARLVARIYFRELLVRLPSLRLCDTGPCEWIHSPTFRSLAGLPVTID